MTRTAARAWCATELSKATGRNLKHVAKAIGDLKKLGLLELVRKEPGPKGGWLHFYRAVRFEIDANQWDRLSELAQESSSAGIVTDLHGDMVAALAAGTFYAHPHHHMTRDHRNLDAEGMKEGNEILLRAYKELLKAEESSLERSRHQGTDLIPVGIGLSLFERAPADFQPSE